MSSPSSFSWKFPPGFLDELRQRLLLSTIIGDYLRFDSKKSKAGRGQFWACCPFHVEKTPSFLCDDQKGRYHCFGCKESGDHISFLMKSGHMPFLEAVESLAKRAGMAMPVRNAKTEILAKKKYQLFEVMALASDFFCQSLQEEEGYKARNYLQKRNVSETIIERFRLGYAPDARAALKEHLLSKGVTLEQMESCGLIGNDEGRIYDRFRGRIIFPIMDLNQHIVGFGGRALSSHSQAKYLNSPATEIFDKGKILYHLVFARNHLKKPQQALRPLIVVEGYMDVLALVENGYDNSVAPLGTALTEEQLQLLWRYSAEPVLCFDGDEAGLKAAYRAMDRALPLLKVDRSLHFVLLPKGRDPDDILRQRGGKGFAFYLEKAISVFDLLWKDALSNIDAKSVEARAKLDSFLKERLAKIQDKTLFYHYDLERKQRLKEFFYQKQSIRHKKRRYEEKSFGKRGSFFQENGVTLDLLEDRGDIIPLREATILCLLLSYPKLWVNNFETLESIEFTHRQARQLYEVMLDLVMSALPETATAMKQALFHRGYEDCVKAVEERGRAAYLPSIENEDNYKIAEETLKQTCYLNFLQSQSLAKKINLIEQEAKETQNEDRFLHYVELQRSLESMSQLDALLDDNEELKH